MNKSVKAKLKKRLGLPPARNIGSKETKAAMKRLDRRMCLGAGDFWGAMEVSIVMVIPIPQ